MYACGLHPEKLRRLSPGFAGFAGRIYGYVDKAHISNQEVRAMEEKNTPLCVKKQSGSLQKAGALQKRPLPFVVTPARALGAAV